MRRATATRAVVLAVVALAVTACQSPPLASPERTTAEPPVLPMEPGNAGPPTGRVSVAYPEEPSRFLAPFGSEVAVDDLSALWGLPLLRLDEAGQVRRGLAEDWEVVGSSSAGWQVVLDLAEGAWSDGTPVVPEDVVASVDAQVTADPGRFGVVRGVEAGDGTVTLTFDRPYASWSDLLVEMGTMLPASVVADGAPGYDTGVPVSGGWYRLAAVEPGLSATFTAHPDGPLGPPGLAEVEVLFTPSFETALGLLESGTADVALGYLALNASARARDVEGVAAAAPLGGTSVSLDFRVGGALGGTEDAARRRGVAETLRVEELVEGLLGPAGRPASTPWPGVEAPVAPPVGEVREGQEFVVLVPRESEVVGFTARALQRDLTARGMSVDLVTEPAPRFAQVRSSERDVALVIRRLPRRPSLAPWVADAEVAWAAGASTVTSTAAEEALTAVGDLAVIAPLYRAGVAHAWRGVEGMRPSSWPGAGFWNVGAWTRTG